MILYHSYQIVQLIHFVDNPIVIGADSAILFHLFIYLILEKNFEYI